MVEVTQEDACLHCGGRLEGRVDSREKVHPYRVVCLQCGVCSAWHGDVGKAWSSILARASTAPDAEPVACITCGRKLAGSLPGLPWCGACVAGETEGSTHPDEPVANRPVTSNPVDDRGSGNTSDKAMAQAVEAVRETGEYMIDRFQAVIRGEVVRDLAEAEGAFRAALAAMGERS